MGIATRVLAFYDAHPINEAQILAALKRQGKLAGALEPEDLYAHDQDHYGGIAAVDALAEHARIAPGSRVLDVCAGLGGPARYLAHTRRAQVVGVELNAGRAAAAARLSALVGLGGGVRMVRGDATRLPFAEASFDAVVSQEAFLHIADKAALFDGCRRVLKPGGRLAFTDWIAFAGLADRERRRLAEGIAAEALHDVASYRRLIEAAGLCPLSTDDLTAEWRPILEQRLEMYQGMGAATVRQFGRRRQRAFIAAYRLFVGCIEAGTLGGRRFVAAR